MSQFIDGKRCESLHGRASVVRDPSNGDTIAEITLAEPDDLIGPSTRRAPRSRIGRTQHQWIVLLC